MFYLQGIQRFIFYKIEKLNPASRNVGLAWEVSKTKQML